MEAISSGHPIKNPPSAGFFVFIRWVQDRWRGGRSGRLVGRNLLLQGVDLVLHLAHLHQERIAFGRQGILIHVGFPACVCAVVVWRGKPVKAGSGPRSQCDTEMLALSMSR